MQLIKAFHDVFQVGACVRLSAQHCQENVLRLRCWQAAFNSLALPVCLVRPDCTAKVELLADGLVRFAGLLQELRDLIQVKSQLE